MTATMRWLPPKPILSEDAPMPPPVRELVAKYGGETTPNGVSHVLVLERLTTWAGPMPRAFLSFGAAALWTARDVLTRFWVERKPLSDAEHVAVAAELDELYWPVVTLDYRPLNERTLRDCLRLIWHERQTFSEEKIKTAGPQTPRSLGTSICVALERARAVSNIARLFLHQGHHPHFEHLARYAKWLQWSIEAAAPNLDCKLKGYFAARDEFSDELSPFLQFLGATSAPPL